MWYCGGGWFEPDCIGYAESVDGVHWNKHIDNPVFTPEPTNIWEKARVAGPSILYDDGWFWLFYIGYEDLFNFLGDCNAPSWFGEFPKDLHTLVISGEEDPVGNYGKGVQTVFERLKAAKIRDLCCKLYPKARHELHNELHKEQMMQDVLVWMKSRIE